MNNDLEQFSEEELTEIISDCTGEIYNSPTNDEATVSQRVLLSLARIALSAKQAKPIGFVGKSYTMTYFMPPQDSGVEIDDLIYTTPQPAHTEQDGWIKCSERMPDDEQECLVQTHSGYRYVSFYDEHTGLFFDSPGGNQINCIEHILVTHWQPFTAPKPERE